MALCVVASPIFAAPLVVLPAFAPVAAVQAAQEAKGGGGEKKVLNVDSYGEWRRVSSVQLSADGRWMSYGYNPNEGDATLFIRDLKGDDLTEIERGSRPSFSDDSKWAAYFVNPPERENGRRGGGQRGGQRGGDANARVTAELFLKNLETGDETTFKNAASIVFAGGAKHAAIKKRGATNGNDGPSGADLVVLDLAHGSMRNVGNVGEFAFDEFGESLAYTVDAADQDGNGVYMLDLSSGAVTAVDTGRHTYSRLTRSEDGTRLAALKGDAPDGMKRRDNDVVVFDVGARKPVLIQAYDAGADESFPEGMVVSEFGSLSFSEDGSMLFLGLDEQEAEPEKSDEERANVDVWHWEDERVQSVQIVQRGRDERATFQSVLRLDDGKFLRLADDDMRSVQILGDGRWGLGRNDAAYRGEVAWGGSRADYYKVDLETGRLGQVTMSLGRQMGASPDGRWFLFLKAGRVMARDLDSDKTYDLSDAAEVDFVNYDDDHPYELPAYGVAGYTEDGTSVILNHKFDLYLVALDGSRSTNLTQGVGEREQIRFRHQRLRGGGGFGFGGGAGNDEWIDTGEPLLLSAYGQWTKKSGYYEVLLGEEPTPLLYEDKSVGRPIKAEDASTLLLTMQTFEEYPDYYVTDTTFSTPVKVTDANSQVAEHKWGSRILIDYKNSKGQPLQATLAIPEGYKKGDKLPMLVYFYELMSQRHHQFSMPSYDDRPHFSTYVSNGYLVLQPDVVYETGRPGDSAVDCVTSAVQAVIDLGYVDPERIGLQGHSWGGYQSSFILTQTDMFAAVVTGAPVTNLVSFYNELYKRTGTVQHGIMEVGQVRMGTTPWDDMELYHSQSPLHNVRNITTPFVILHGTADGAVDWHQGLEYYNAARRNGKEVVLLSYPNEPHHLGVKANQIDFQIRMKQFFDHYLQDAPAPGWWTEGVPHLKKDTTPVR